MAEIEKVIVDKEQILEHRKGKPSKPKEAESKLIEVKEVKLEKIRENALKQKEDSIKDPAIQCYKWKRKYNVVPGSSWGDLSIDLQKLWTKLNCDKHLPDNEEELEEFFLQLY